MLPLPTSSNYIQSAVPILYIFTKLIRYLFWFRPAKNTFYEDYICLKKKLKVQTKCSRQKMANLMKKEQNILLPAHSHRAQYTFLKSVSHFPYVDAISCCCYFKLCCWQSQMTMKYLCALSYPVFSLARSLSVLMWACVCIIYIFIYARKYCYMCASTAGSAAFDPHQQSFPLEINIAGGVIETRERK